jgi:hypothetical protein
VADIETSSVGALGAGGSTWARRVAQVVLMGVVAEMAARGVLGTGWRPGGRAVDVTEGAAPLMVSPSGNVTGLPRGLFPVDGVVLGADGPRVLFVGDSFTYGQGVSPAHRFSDRTAEALGVEAITLAAPGLSAWDELALYRELGRHYAPDVVVWTFVLNDLDGGVPPGGVRGGWDDLVVDRRTREPVSGLQLWSWVRGVWEAREMTHATVRGYQQGLDPLIEPESFEALERGLIEVVASVEARGGRVLFAVFPMLHGLDAYPFEDAHRAVLAVAEHAGAETLDLLPAFAGKDPAALWVSTADHHPNAVAHELAARALVGALGEVKRATGCSEHLGPCGEGVTADVWVDHALRVAAVPDEAQRHPYAPGWLPRVLAVMAEVTAMGTPQQRSIRVRTEPLVEQR